MSSIESKRNLAYVVKLADLIPILNEAGNSGVSVTAQQIADIIQIDKSQISDFVESDYATGAEGDLAVSALQNIANQSIKNLNDVFGSMSPNDGDVLTFDTTNGWQSEVPTGGTGGGGLDLSEIVYNTNTFGANRYLDSVSNNFFYGQQHFINVGFSSISSGNYLNAATAWYLFSAGFNGFQGGLRLLAAPLEDVIVKMNFTDLTADGVSRTTDGFPRTEGKLFVAFDPKWSATYPSTASEIKDARWKDKDWAVEGDWKSLTFTVVQTDGDGYPEVFEADVPEDNGYMTDLEFTIVQHPDATGDVIITAIGYVSKYSTTGGMLTTAQVSSIPQELEYITPVSSHWAYEEQTARFDLNTEFIAHTNEYLESYFPIDGGVLQGDLIVADITNLIGSELVVDGDFPNFDNWTETANWIAIGGQARAFYVTGTLTQLITGLEIGKQYLLSFNVQGTKKADDTLLVSVGAFSFTAPWDYPTGATTFAVKKVFIAQNTSDLLSFAPTGSFYGNVNTVTIKETGAGTVVVRDPIADDEVATKLYVDSKNYDGTYVDLTTAQTVGGVKTFTDNINSDGSINAGTALTSKTISVINQAPTQTLGVSFGDGWLFANKPIGNYGQELSSFKFSAYADDSLVGTGSYSQFNSYLRLTGTFPFSSTIIKGFPPTLEFGQSSSYNSSGSITCLAPTILGGVNTAGRLGSVSYIGVTNNPWYNATGSMAEMNGIVFEDFSLSKNADYANGIKIPSSVSTIKSRGIWLTGIESDGGDFVFGADELNRIYSNNNDGLLVLESSADAGVTSFKCLTTISHTSGNLWELDNNGTVATSIDYLGNVTATSYNGVALDNTQAGTLFLSDDGTYKSTIGDLLVNSTTGEDNIDSTKDLFTLSAHNVNAIEIISTGGGVGFESGDQNFATACGATTWVCNNGPVGVFTIDTGLGEASATASASHLDQTAFSFSSSKSYTLTVTYDATTKGSAYGEILLGNETTVGQAGNIQIANGDINATTGIFTTTVTGISGAGMSYHNYNEANEPIAQILTEFSLSEIVASVPSVTLNYGGVEVAKTTANGMDITGQLSVNTISEVSANSGVTIEGVLLKDNNITTAGTITSGTINGATITSTKFNNVQVELNGETNKFLAGDGIYKSITEAAPSLGALTGTGYLGSGADLVAAFESRYPDLNNPLPDEFYYAGALVADFNSNSNNKLTVYDAAQVGNGNGSLPFTFCLEGVPKNNVRVRVTHVTSGFVLEATLKTIYGYDNGNIDFSVDRNLDVYPDAVIMTIGSTVEVFYDHTVQNAIQYINDNRTKVSWDVSFEYGASIDITTTLSQAIKANDTYIYFDAITLPTFVDNKEMRNYNLYISHTSSSEFYLPISTLQSTYCTLVSGFSCKFDHPVGWTIKIQKKETVHSKIYEIEKATSTYRTNTTAAIEALEAITNPTLQPFTEGSGADAVPLVDTNNHYNDYVVYQTESTTVGAEGSFGGGQIAALGIDQSLISIGDTMIVTHATEGVQYRLIDTLSYATIDVDPEFSFKTGSTCTVEFVAGVMTPATVEDAIVELTSIASPTPLILYVTASNVFTVDVSKPLQQINYSHATGTSASMNISNIISGRSCKVVFYNERSVTITIAMSPTINKTQGSAPLTVGAYSYIVFELLCMSSDIGELLVNKTSQ